MEGHFVSIFGESVDTDASCYDYCGVLVCGLGLGKVRVEMTTMHHHISEICNDTQDHVSFMCMLHTLSGSIRPHDPEDVRTIII
jgi:hypothetical protein